MKITPHPSKPELYLLAHPRYSPALVEAARHIPGIYRASVTQGCAIEGSADALEAAVEWLVGSRGLRKEAFENTCEWAMSAKTKFNHSGMWYPEKLREYQRDAVVFLLQEKRAILADDMGLGKTASAITAATLTEASRILVVCPSYVRGVWHNTHDRGEIGKWAPDARNIFHCIGVKNVSLAAGVRADADVAICHYDILHAWASTLAAWKPDVVIFDEAHYLTNPDSQRTKAAVRVSREASYVWGLTGTPMTNRPKDLWGVLSTVVPGRFGDPEEGFFRFGLRYCDAQKEAVTPTKTVWKFDGASHLPELRARMRHFMLRRTKSEVAKELPAKTRQVIRVDAGRRDVALTSLSGKSALRAALGAAADAKLTEYAAPVVREHLDAGRKVVVTSYRRSVAEWFAREFSGALIHGGIPMTKREATLLSLRGAEGGSLLATTIDSTSTGIDLSYADVGILVELTYEPHELLQWEARFHRLTTKEPKLYQYLIARGTADELIADAVLAKLDVFAEAIGAIDGDLRSDMREKEEDIMADLYARLGL